MKKKISPSQLVILDTNALMMPFQFELNIDVELNRILGSYKIIVPSYVIEELKALIKKEKFADSALKLAKKYEIIKSPVKGDEGIIELAKELNAIVVTNDRTLKEKLSSLDLPVVYLRSKTYLALRPSVRK